MHSSRTNVWFGAHIMRQGGIVGVDIGWILITIKNVQCQTVQSNDHLSKLCSRHLGLVRAWKLFKRL